MFELNANFSRRLGFHLDIYSGIWSFTGLDNGQLRLKSGMYTLQRFNAFRNAIADRSFVVVVIG